MVIAGRLWHGVGGGLGASHTLPRLSQCFRGSVHCLLITVIVTTRPVSSLDGSLCRLRPAQSSRQPEKQVSLTSLTSTLRTISTIRWTALSVTIRILTAEFSPHLALSQTASWPSLSPPVRPPQVFKCNSRKIADTIPFP